MNRTNWYGLLIAAIVTACAHAPMSGPPAELTGEWTRVDDENASPHNPTLRFSETAASGFSGCRSWSSRISGANGQLSFAGIRHEGGRCDAAPARAAEDNFFAALRRTRAVRLERGELTFVDGAGAAVARFARAE